MLKRTFCPQLRHIFSVTAATQDAISRAQKLAGEKRSEILASHGFASNNFHLEQELDASMKNLVSLRVGGAKVLSPVERTIQTQSEKSPLHFSAVRPRDSGLCQQLCRALAKLRIRKLTELQGALVPQLLRGKHVIGHAETGSGKSFGIALATCNRMLREQTTNRLHTLVLVPTDALALQYDRWFKHFAGTSRQIVLAAVSQFPLENQLAQLHNVQPHVLVGTPQRLSEIASLCPIIIGEKLRAKVDCIVLDEADVLLKTPIAPPDEDDERVAMKFNRQYASVSSMSNNNNNLEVSASSSVSDCDSSNNNSNRNLVLSCGELIDRLYRSEATELPAQVVATSATFDGETATRLNTWMRNEDVVRLTTSIEEQAIPETLNFHFISEKPPQFPMHELLHLTLQHIACQVRRPKVLIFANEEEVDISQLVRYVSEIEKFPQDVNEKNNNNSKNNNRWDCVSLQADFEAPSHDKEEEQEGEGKEGSSKTSSSSSSSSARRSMMSNNNSRSSNININTNSSRKIIGRNGEIFCFNDSNLSRLDRGRAEVGVAHYSLARGLHISNVTHVILYGEIPGSTEFLHCAGRTGRRGKTGDVICIFSPASGRNLKLVCETLRIPWHVNRAADVQKALLHSCNEVLS